MLKKFLAAGMLCLGGISAAHAAYPTFYLAPAIVYDSIKNSELTFQGLAPRLSIGYGDFRMDPAFLAVELVLMPLKPMSINNVTVVTLSGQTQSLKPKYTYGISFLPGVNLDNVMKLFSRLGIVNTYFDDENTSRRGYQIGAGIEWIFNPTWSARFEYTRVAYTQFSSVAGGTPDTDEFALSFVYRFVGLFGGSCDVPSALFC